MKAVEPDKRTENDRNEIERAITEVKRSQDGANEIQSMFDEHRVDIPDHSKETQQEAYAITYEMIADRASANETDTALKELDTESILDHNSNPDLEGILDANQVDDKLMDAIHELGIDSVDDSVPGEDESEYAEVLEYGGW